MRLIILLFGLLTIQVSAFAQRPPDGGDIQYGSHPDETLDYWVGASANSPILFLIHGGGWRSGDKRSTNWRNAAQLFYDKGYAVVNINYILSVDTNYTGFPMQPQNVACAIAWTKTNADLINGDTNKIILFGNSAGAHLASLHGLHHPNNLLQNCSSSSSLDVLGVIALSGMFDFDLAPINNQNSIQAIRDMVVDSVNYWVQAQPI